MKFNIIIFPQHNQPLLLRDNSRSSGEERDYKNKTRLICGIFTDDRHQSVDDSPYGGGRAWL